MMDLEERVGRDSISSTLSFYFIIIYRSIIRSKAVSDFCVPGAQVLRSPAREMVLLRSARDLLAALPAAERGHRDLPRQQK